MRKLVNRIKRSVPPPLWQAVRRPYYRLRDAVRDLGPYVRRRNYCGIVLYYNRGNNIIGRLKKEPIFEKEMCQAIVKELGKAERPVFVDIGANIGLISAYVISKIPNVSIHAFEPGPVQRSSLAMTVERNHLAGKMTIYGEALGKEIGTAKFYSHDPKYVAGDGFIDTRRARDPHAIEVRVNTLDAWWRSKGKPAVQAVKIDTEGAELWVLQGAGEFVRACKPVIFMEIEPQNLRVYPHDHFDILAHMQSLGYSLFALEGGEVTKENFDALIQGGEDTYVALPKP